MANIKKHVTVIKETNIKKIEGTDLYRFLIWVSFSDYEKPCLLNYEIDNLQNLQNKFKFTEDDFSHGSGIFLFGNA